MVMEETHRDRMSNAIGVWVKKLDDVQGWTEYRRNRLRHTLDFDDPFFMPSEPPGDFVFPPDIEKQHAIIVQYLGLQQTIEALKECEYYFRRYPFRGLPVSRDAHLTNVCEMYFGRFYEFKERLKNYFDAVKVVEPKNTLEIGKFVKLFDKVFDQELRARNKVHHHARFEDIAIDKVLVTSVIANANEKKGWEQGRLVAYRKATNEWSKRVSTRGAKMDEFLEAIAEATLTVCRYLTS
jgi:hypothetical protein